MRALCAAFLPRVRKVDQHEENRARQRGCVRNGTRRLRRRSSASRAGLDRGPTLEGVDVDGNGIRDDIDAFIGSNYSTEPQRRAASQLAAHFQKTILVDKSDRAALKRQSVLGARAVGCVYDRFNGVDGSKQAAAVVWELEAVTANTRARLKAYWAYSKGLDGTVISMTEGDTCVPPEIALEDSGAIPKLDRGPTPRRNRREWQ